MTTVVVNFNKSFRFFSPAQLTFLSIFNLIILCESNDKDVECILNRFSLNKSDFYIFNMTLIRKEVNHQKNDPNCDVIQNSIVFYNHINVQRVDLNCAYILKTCNQL